MEKGSSTAVILMYMVLMYHGRVNMFLIMEYL